jgi:hypothetical protein
MAPRKPSAKKPDSRHELEEFAEKYETLSAIYEDPVQVVFDVMATTMDEDTRLRAAEMLMSYRYPKLKSLENAPGNAPTMQFQVILQQPATLPAPEQAVTIDVTPKLAGKAA